MTIRRCIPELLGSGKINDEQAARMRDLFEGYERMYGDEARASDATASAMEREAALKKRQTVLQIAAQMKIAEDLRLFRVDKPGAAAEALLAGDDRAPYRNVEFMEKALINQHFSMMNGLISQFSRGALGKVRDVATLHDVLKEAFGEHTGNESAAILAKSWLETAESLRTLFNERGGAIGKIDKWGMPQTHSMMAVRSRPFEEWRDDLMGTDDKPGWLDRGNMIDEETGLPMDPKQLEAALQGVHATISSDGWNDRTPGAFTGNGKIANRHADARFLKFKDADSWLAYSQKYGRPLSALSQKIDPGSAVYDAMISHVHAMAKDIALMERLGPNPAATIRWVKDGLKKEAMLPGQPKSRSDAADRSAHHIDDMYKELTGGFGVANKALATAAGGFRTWEGAAKLGSSVINHFHGLPTHFMARRFNGLPSIGLLKEYAGSLKPTSAADRAHAARQWHITDSAARSMSAYNIWSGEAMTGEIPARLSNFVMHASLLNKWVDEGRRLFNKQIWAAITDHAGKSWDTLKSNGTYLNPTHRFRTMLERHGFTESDWNTLRSTPLQEDGGAHWILPDNVSDQNLARRVAEMALQETEMAVPTSSLRVRAALSGALKKGTVAGELGRSALQFRGFPIQLFWQQGARALSLGGWGAVKYAASLYIMSTVVGALGVQMRNLMNGEDLENMNPLENPGFYAQASLYGGGLGIIGDIIKDFNRKDLTKFAADNSGVAVSAITDIAKVFVKKNQNKKLAWPGGGSFWAKGQPSALAQAIKNNTPGATIWYVKLALQREIIDQMETMIDPNYQQSAAKMDRYARENGTRYWWKGYNALPDRAPAYSDVVPPKHPDG